MRFLNKMIGGEKDYGNNYLIFPKRLFLFTIPALLILLVFWVSPVVVMVVSSFTEHSGSILSSNTGILDNYSQLFVDAGFKTSILNTILYTVYLVIGANVLGFFLALSIQKLKRGKMFFQFVLYLPAVLSTIVGSYVWSYMYMSDSGVVAKFLNVFGFHGTFNLLGNDKLALFVLATIDIWKSFGICMIIYMAAMKNLDRDLIAAAHIDGCYGFSLARKIIIPVIYPSIIINVVFMLINGLKTFDYSFIITNGGPGHSTATLMYNAYKIAFTDGQIPKAYALSTVSLTLIIVLTIIAVRLLETKEATYEN